ncbi:hypothetical protein [Desulfoluna sp.]|uniref:hypothetical protein n=1 Tax=Desulfoluna sp. TaxID=2045199 RepID=UPI0026057994|nr:hypothetical protein [Desulfoluna sp.]
MGTGRKAMLRDRGLSMTERQMIHGLCGFFAGGIGYAVVMVVAVVALTLALPGRATAEATPAQGTVETALEPAANGPGNQKEEPPSNAEITQPSGSTDALMDAYNERIQRVMDQADPFSSITPEDAFSVTEALKNNQEYKKALELYLKLDEETSEPEAFSGAAEASEAIGLDERVGVLAGEAQDMYEKQYEAFLMKAKAHENMGELPEARLLIERAMMSMAEDGTGVDAAVLDLYKEIMEKVSGRSESEPSEEDIP